MRSLVGFFSIILFCSAVAAESLVPLIPVVPAAKAKADLPVRPVPVTTNRTTKRSQPSNALNIAPEKLDRSRITMQPGVNEIVQVALNHLNRIVTPYIEPKITTSSPATTEVRDNVIYIGTTQSSPLTLFITEQGSEEQALSLTLIPQKIPPREIFLKLSESNSYTQVSQRAKKWEETQPYIATIEKLFRSIALGELPSGYNFSKLPKGQLPACRQSGLEFDFTQGQTVMGHHFIVHVGLAVNTSPGLIEFVEDTCGDWDIAAVAAFPKNALMPGERTEIYIAQKRNYKREIKIERPSLLLGGK